MLGGISLRRLMLLLTIALAVTIWGMVAVRPAMAATDWGKALADSTISRFPDAKTLSWRYPQALFLEGLYQLHLRTGDARYLDYLKRWADTHVDASGTMFDDGARKTPVNLSRELDQLLPGRLMILLHRLTGTAKYKLAAQKLRQRFDVWPRTSEGGLWHRWGLTDQLWADGTYMALPFVIEYGRAFGDASYGADEAARQLLVYGRHLQDESSGLIIHGYDESRASAWADPATGLSPEVWCRGMGWYAVTLVEVLQLLPASHPDRAELSRRLGLIADGIARYQDPATGLWYQVVDKGSDPANWHETSCSAMFAYALSRGVEAGFLSGSLQDAATRGYQGVLTKLSLGPDNLTNLIDTVVGTSVGDAAYYYARTRPLNDWHGLGTVLMMYEQFNKLPFDAVLLWKEAESASVTKPFFKGTDATASGGKDVRIKNGKNSLAKVPSAGRLSYGFTVPRAGPYRIWARVIAPTIGDDSYWLRIDSGAWRLWDGIERGTAWHWVEALTAPGGPTLELNLTKGKHTLALAPREDGIRIDRLLITDVKRYVPTGPGG
ncbi:MAG: glycoside hydrolase family 88 protein [Geminicoccaceae bacterium]